MLNSLGKFIELGPSILRSVLDSGLRLAGSYAAFILRLAGSSGREADRMQHSKGRELPKLISLPVSGPPYLLASPANRPPPQRQEACYVTDEEKIEPLKSSMCVTIKGHTQRSRPPVGKLRACTPPPPSRISLATALYQQKAISSPATSIFCTKATNIDS